MNHLRMALTASVAFCAASPAFAQSVGCTAINGFTSSVVSVRVFEELTSGAFEAGEVITLTASSVTASVSAGDPVWAFADLALASIGFFGDGAFSPSFGISATPIREMVAVPTGGIGGLALTEFGPISTDLNDVEISCTSSTPEANPTPEAEEPIEETVVEVAAPPVRAVVASLSGIGAFHQNQSVRSGMDQNLRTRVQGGSRSNDTVTQSGVFVSTQGKSEAATGTNVWLSFSGRSYFDGYEGYSADVAAGMDWMVGGSSVVGLMIGAGATDLQDSVFADSKTSSYMIGAYAGHGFASGVQIDGYIAHSAVDYEVGATAFDTTRTLAGLSVSGDVAVSTGVVQPRARISGSWEDFPAGIGGVTGGTTEQYTGSLGARHEWNTTVLSSGLTPWASLDIEYGYQENTSGASDDFMAPRIGLGLFGAVGEGILSTSVDVGRVRSDVYDVGFEVSYRYSF
jgi:hypothetical protein